jgi:hypothetical protein
MDAADEDEHHHAKKPPLAAFAGRWTDISSAYFLPRFLAVRGHPFVELTEEAGDRFSGRFRVAAVEGFIDGRPDDRGGLILSFVGKAAGDPVHGAGTAAIVDGALIVRLMPFRGDVWDVLAAARGSRT